MAGVAPEPSIARLPAAEDRLGLVLRRPKILAAFCVVALTVLGWLYIGIMLGHAGAEAPVGSAWSAGRRLFDVLCLPSFVDSGGRHSGISPLAAWSLVDAGLVFMMWCAMALAMMLPSAGPMIMTYAEIADTAGRKGIAVVSPFVLAAGYLAAWIGFCIAATSLQQALTAAALMNRSLALASPALAGAVLGLAGLYQFSAVKHACLIRCQRPFPYFFAHWSTEPGRIFGLGLRQGLFCLGCCWAMMLVMFAVGVMNVVWMALLGAIMSFEKLSTTSRFSNIVGVVFVAIGLAMLGAAALEQWQAWRG
jgi:predicted metal-binding membrane protein